MSDWPRWGRPAYSETEEEVIEKTVTYYIEDIVNIRMSRLATWEIVEKIVDTPVERVTQIERKFEEGFYRKFVKLIRSCVRIGNELVVLSKIVVKKHRSGKRLLGRRYYHSFYGSIPRRSASSLRDFANMRQFSKKKGLIQLMYYYLLENLKAKYRELIKYAPREIETRKKAIKEQLRKMSYLGETDPDLEDELETIQKKINAFKEERHQVEAERAREREALLEREKAEIKSVVELLNKHAHISSRYVFDFRYQKESDLKKFKEKFQVILNNNIEQYHEKLNKFLETINNWREIHDSTELTREVQSHIDKIKAPFIEKEKQLIREFTEEIEKFYQKEFCESFERKKAQIEKEFEQLQDLQTALLEKHRDIAPEVEALVLESEERTKRLRR